MGARAFVSNYWRIIVLVLFVSAALFALFVPGGVFGNGTASADDAGPESDPLGNATPANASDASENATTDEGLTNLVYGLSLDGGTRLSAPVVGSHVDDLDLGIQPGADDEFAADLAAELGVDSADVEIRYDENTGLFTAETFTDNVSDEAFADGLSALNGQVSAGDVDPGVTRDTRDEIVTTIDLKLNQAGLSGVSVTQRDVGGEWFIVVEAPDQSPQELRDVLSQRGVVEVQAYYPDGDGGQENETVLEQEDFDQISSPAYNEQNGHHVPVTVTDSAAPEYQERMNDLGFTQRGTQCFYGAEEFEGQNHCLLTVVDGEVVSAHGMDNSLGSDMADGTWATNPRFIMGAGSQAEAQGLAANLNAGALTAPLDFDRDEVLMIQPTLADQYKNFSLVIGVLAVFAVSGMVYLRYTDHRVALPMILTALTEVIVLLGIAAAMRYPIGLPEVAAFIAVVGTGVDDLIIIADEVMSEGDVNSKRVFASRFRKAFWVIGAAAGTTIVAMAPLAVLNIGDLRGFAILTILGVLVGVLVTRPAYGDILRLLLTDR